MAFPGGSPRPVTRITGLSNRRFCRTCPRRMDVAAETETDPGRRRHWLRRRSRDRRSVTARAENRNSARFDLVSYQLRVGRVRHRPFKSLETGLRSCSRATDSDYGKTEDELDQRPNRGDARGVSTPALCHLRAYPYGICSQKITCNMERMTKLALGHAVHNFSRSYKLELNILSNI